MKREDYHDPSYAMVSFSRISAGGEGLSLFGSSIKHHSAITLSIKQARLSRDTDLSHDWYFAENRFPLIEVTLSPNQFAELLTSMNVGDGVPATLTLYNGQGYEYPDNIPT